MAEGAGSIPDDRVPDILARAAEIDRDRKETSSVEALRAVALDAGISVDSLEKALEEYAARTKESVERGGRRGGRLSRLHAGPSRLRQQERLPQ
ncbi:MAG TPA: hypothetical protein VK966_03820, partial [Longimicrobiales bacterium]|nr:hypothetical protein [Longimicrobiales bacterium]